jgi:predicted O-methyltransferase YrrM
MLCDGNIKLIDFAIKNMPNEGSVLEIGSYGGLSTNLIAHLIKKHKKNNLLFNCDAWIYEGFHDHKDINDNNIDGRNDVSRAAYSVYMKQSFNMFSISFFDKWDNNETLIDMFGNSATLGGSISFAYIDGGHSYEVAWQDFTNVSKYLSTGGYILLDDSADSMSFGSSKMMSEIKKNNAFKIIDKAPNYLIQKIK